MINQLYISNFKSIKKHKFALKNLNLLVGLNGIGKSSFIELLLCLHQANNSTTTIKELPLNGRIIELGTFKDILYQFAKDEYIELKFTFSEKEIVELKLSGKPGNDWLEFINHDTYLEQNKEKFASIQNAQDRDVLTLFYALSPLYHAVKQLEKMYYISADRIPPKSLHKKSRIELDNSRVGIHGELAAYFLVYNGNSDIQFKNMAHPKAHSLHLIDQVNAWLGEVSPGIKINVEEIAGADTIKMDVQYYQPKLGYTNKFKPMHVGFGITSILPVITLLLSASPGDLIIIDSPESHIHPLGQAVIGRLAALAANNKGVQIIMESHSDHVLNGIRVAVKENFISNNHVSVFYFDKVITNFEQYAKITNISIDKRGELSSYPDNLLSEWTNQLMRLM